MAQAPQRPPQPAPRAPAPTQAPIARREPNPEEPPVKTVGQEQYERSRQAEDEGPADNDERGRQKQVRGVSRTQVDDGEEVPGTPYTPPEGHTEMNPAPGEPGGPTAGHYPDEEADADRRGDRQEDRQSRR